MKYRYMKCLLLASLFLAFDSICSNAFAAGGDLKLAMADTARLTSIAPGQTASYRAQVLNVGDQNSKEGRRVHFNVTGASAGVQVQNVKPVEPTGITCTAPNILSGQYQFDCNVTSLVPGAERNMTFDVVIADKPAVTSFCANGLIIVDPTDPNASNDRVQDCKTIVIPTPPPPPPVTMALAVTGPGSVIGKITGTSTVILNCGSAGTKCGASVGSGTTLTFTANPGAGFLFDGWSQGTESAAPCNGTRNDCTIKILKNSSLAATFSKAVTQ